MSSMSTDVCAVCGRSDWRPLPSPKAKLLITTAGKLVENSFGKSQCSQCGAVQKIAGGRLADTDYYERQYTYYDRPGAENFDVVRYRALARWVEDAMAACRPASVFDVGCGRGGTMRYLREAWPQARFAGIEPSADAATAARVLGFDVEEGRLTLDRLINGTFDVVFSNNVLQHTTDPVEFIRAQARLLSPDGRLVLSCPDGTKPSVELVMADQNFSLCPPHLDVLAARAGMCVERHLPCPGGPLRNEQLAVMRRMNAAESQTAVLPSRQVIDAAHVQLATYLNAWAEMDAVLVRATAGARRVFNFGGGLWSYVLAAYCPQYWARVECCLVDGFAGRCIDSEVKPFESVTLSPDDILVLGTNPYVQPKLVTRFAGAGLRAVSWDHIIAD
jgi:SAM-dependent methyltransferase